MANQYKLINGELFELTDSEIKEINLHSENLKESKNLNEPLDRTRIDDETKNELKNMILKYPETRVLAKILLGKKETEILLRENS